MADLLVFMCLLLFIFSFYFNLGSACHSFFISDSTAFSKNENQHLKRRESEIEYLVCVLMQAGEMG